MRRSLAPLVMACWVTLSSGFATPSFAASKKMHEPVAGRASRTINFPKGHSIGALYLIPKINDGFIGDEKPAAIARGTVTLSIPPDCELILDGNTDLLQHPADLDSLPANAIDGIRLLGIDIEEASETLVDRALTHVAHLTGLKRVYVDKSDATDSGLAKLKSVTGLQTLIAALTVCDGSFLQSLDKAPNLQDLDLSQLKLNEKNLQSLGKFPKLEKLWAHQSGISDNGLQFIGQCRQLKILYLRNNPKISDEGMKHLTTLVDVDQLVLRQTHVTAKGLAELKQIKRLRNLFISTSSCTPQELAALKKLMPATAFYYEKETPDVDKTMGRLFSPLK